MLRFPTVRLATFTRTLAITLALHISAPSLADPLHEVGSEAAWRHEGSGWHFPLRIDGFERVGAPYTIDGNDDVGAEYASTANGTRLTMFVEVYYADSAASGARLDSAKAMQSTSRPGVVTHLESEEPFVVNAPPELVGIKVSSRWENSLGNLYFFTTPAWVVAIRTTAQPADEKADASLDRLVHSLPWGTLGSDPGNLHGAGS
jgi:hypothetical protein